MNRSRPAFASVMGRRGTRLAFVLAGLVAGAHIARPVRAASQAELAAIRDFFAAAEADDAAAKQALDRIAASWTDGCAALLLDLARFLPSPRRTPDAGDTAPALNPEADDIQTSALPESAGVGLPPGARIRERLTRFLEKQTGQRHGDDLRRWRRWLWSRPYDPHPEYAAFKAAVYARIDRRMAAFFAAPVLPRIRLDEVDWGGVAVNGIPPLDHPAHVAANDAKYLKDKNVVFGVVLNGEARAYPKRILAWHELARDTLGGVPLTLVYCTLCGTAIPYGSEVAGRRLTFGTSGLLYRSNKLMFDEETMSLWSTLEGRPVLGTLAATEAELRSYPIVTTTWREWVARHPETTVLSLDTGFERDYSEGAAYRDYFGSDRLMFEVPQTDERLKNKAEVLALLLRPAEERDGRRLALAFSAAFLQKNPLHQRTFAGHDLVVVTSAAGANRVYAASGTRFARIAADGRHLEDERGQLWEITEDALLPAGRDEAAKRRLPAQRAFWFGWYAQFPQTELVK
jgi:hypothetical protein